MSLELKKRCISSLDASIICRDVCSNIIRTRQEMLPHRMTCNKCNTQQMGRDRGYRHASPIAKVSSAVHWYWYYVM
eukprot:scaffold21431_cov229-Skeletonema_marinoi.AAC.3